MRSPEYNFSHCGYEKIVDEFVLGESMLVAPIVEKGQTVRRVVLPEGIWYGFNSEYHNENCEYEMPV